MHSRGSNLPRVGDYNQMVVLDLIRRHPGISRIELTERTGLTAQTLSNIARKLLDTGLVRDAGRRAGGPGAPRARLEVDPDGCLAVGVLIDPARISTVLLDLGGNVRLRSEIGIAKISSSRQLIDTISGDVERMLSEADVPAARVNGIGLASPGPVDTERGLVLAPPNLRTISVVELRNAVERRLGVPVILEKDTIAVATGEHWARGTESENFVYLYLGTGVGAGIVLGGQVQRGRSSNLGEIAHIGGDPDGPICPSCGNRGCLGSVAEPRHLVRRAAELGEIAPVEDGDVLAVERALAQVCERAEDPTTDAYRIVERSAQAFGRVAANLANALDLDTVVFGGHNWSPLSRIFMAIVPDVVHDQQVVREMGSVLVHESALGEDAGPVGAASLVLSQHASGRVSDLLL